MEDFKSMLSEEKEILLLLKESDSMRETYEGEYWASMLPWMNAIQRRRLKEILITEKTKLREAEETYRRKISHLDKVIKFLKSYFR